MRNFNEIFRKDVTYDNIKSPKKAGLHPISEKHIFGKSTMTVKLTLPAFLGLRTPILKDTCIWVLLNK